MRNTECWWITGASSGIGEGIAHSGAAQGARLILSGRNVTELERVARACGEDKCLILPFDTRDYAAIPALVEHAIAWAGRIDCLVNNAGISQRSLAVDTDFSVYELIIAVDLLAPIALSSCAAAYGRTRRRAADRDFERCGDCGRADAQRVLRGQARHLWLFRLSALRNCTPWHQSTCNRAGVSQNQCLTQRAYRRRQQTRGK